MIRSVGYSQRSSVLVLHTLLPNAIPIHHFTPSTEVQSTIVSHPRGGAVRQSYVHTHYTAGTMSQEPSLCRSLSCLLLLPRLSKQACSHLQPFPSHSAWQISFFRYNSRTIQFTHSRCTKQQLLIHSQLCSHHHDYRTFPSPPKETHPQLSLPNPS